MHQPYNNPPNTSPPITCWASGCNLWFKKKSSMPSMLNYFSSLPPSSLLSFVPIHYLAQEPWKLDQELGAPEEGTLAGPKGEWVPTTAHIRAWASQAPRWALWQANSGSILHLLPAPAWACRAVCSQPHGHSCQISDLLSQHPVLPAFPTDTCPSVQRACYLFSQNWKSHWLSQTPLSLFNHCLQGFSYHMQAFIMKAILPKSSSSPLSHWSLPALVPTLPG